MQKKLKDARWLDVRAGSRRDKKDEDFIGMSPSRTIARTR